MAKDRGGGGRGGGGRGGRTLPPGTTSAIQDRFYEIADASPQKPDVGDAHRIMDALGANVSPDHYDSVLATNIRRILPRLESPEFIDWANDILDTIGQNEGSTHDLRGYRRSIHEVG